MLNRFLGRKHQASQGGVPTDPYWNNVVLLMHFDNPVDNGITFTDVKGHVFTLTGTMNTKLAEAKFGYSGLKASGAVATYLSTPSVADLRLTGDFTIEFWYKHAISDATHAEFIWAKDTTANLSKVMFYNGQWYVSSTTSANFLISSYPSYSVGTWYHIALTKQGTTWRLFSGGAQIGTATLADTFGDNAYAAYIGTYPPSTGSYGMNCSLDELRITSGVARYTADFTPPIAEFPVL